MRYEGKTFTGETITLDGNDYVRCTFSGCTLHYNGGQLSWSDPTFRDGTQILFPPGVDAFSNPVSKWLVNTFMDGGVQVLPNDKSA